MFRLNKKPATALAIAGFGKSCFKCLSFLSHDAKNAAGALPMCHIASHRQVHLDLVGERRVHYTVSNRIYGGLSMVYRTFLQ
jgi:hypothetical protein